MSEMERMLHEIKEKERDRESRRHDERLRPERSEPAAGGRGGRQIDDFMEELKQRQADPAGRTFVEGASADAPRGFSSAPEKKSSQLKPAASVAA